MSHNRTSPPRGRVVRPYCKQPGACVAGSRGACRVCHAEADKGGWHPPKTERNALVVAMREAGRSLSSIATEFGISKQRVHQIVGRAVYTSPSS